MDLHQFPYYVLDSAHLFHIYSIVLLYSLLLSSESQDTFLIKRLLNKRLFKKDAIKAPDNHSFVVFSTILFNSDMLVPSKCFPSTNNAEVSETLCLCA